MKQAALVIEMRVGTEGIRDLDLVLTAARIDLVPFGTNQARLAREAFRRFGKGHQPAPS